MEQQTQKPVLVQPTQQPPPAQPVLQQPVAPHKESSLQRNLKQMDWPIVIVFGLIAMTSVIAFLLEREKQLFIAARQELTTRTQQQESSKQVSSADIQILEDAFVRQNEVIDFIQQIEQARFAFYSFELNFTSDEPNGKKLLYFPFIVKLEGPIDNIILFLEAFTQSEYVVDITSVELTDDKGLHASGLLTLEGNLYVGE
jgi:hypothetical protein